MLADVLGRDGAELSATQTRRRNLANADHLGILHAIWTAETTGAHDDRYRALVLSALPPGHRQDLSPQGRWLFRTLRAAELAGLDPAEVLRTAIASATWPVPGTSPPSWTPGSGRASTRCCPSRKAPGPAASCGWPIPHVRLTWPRSPP